MIEINENWSFESAEAGDKVLGAVIYRPACVQGRVFRAVLWGQKGGRVNLGPYKEHAVMVVGPRELLVDNGAVMPAEVRNQAEFAAERDAIQRVLAAAVQEGRF